MMSSSIVFTPPSVPPFPGDRNLRGEEETAPPPRRSEPFYSMVGGPSEVYASFLCGMGPHGHTIQDVCCLLDATS